MGESVNIRQLLELAAVRLGITPEQLMSMARSGQLSGMLSPERQAQLASLLYHPEKAEEFLSDPEVKDAVRKWQDGK